MKSISDFYTAFQQKDWKTMQNCYHPEARFSDPAFPGLEAAEVKAMWKMLVLSGKDLSLQFRVLEETSRTASVLWIADYTFSSTRRKVRNVITARIDLKDGLIYRHRDEFSFWRWSRQALGPAGWLLGWTPFLKQKVQAAAREKLTGFMQKES